MTKKGKLHSTVAITFAVMVELIFPTLVSAQPSAQVVKECSAVTLDEKSFMIFLHKPLSPARYAAMNDIEKLKARPELLNCNKIDLTSWNSIKADYIKRINQANLNMQKIVAKYFKNEDIEITCSQAGEITKVTGPDPKCPSGYKKLY